LTKGVGLDKKDKKGVHWRWVTNFDTQKVCLELAAGVNFPTVFKISELLSYDLHEQPFSTSDAFLYSLFRDKFSYAPFDEEQAFTLAINATIASQYLKPLAAKSWLFHPASSAGIGKVKQGDWVALKATDEAIYLVLDTDHETSDVILASNRHQISDSRVIFQGQTLKVHNDRLTPTLIELKADQL